MITVYQPKGKGHINYIRRMAYHIWQKDYGCRNEDWHQSIKDALEIHRTYLITGIKMTRREMEYRKANRRVKRAGTWWRNQITGKFEPLLA